MPDLPTKLKRDAIVEALLDVRFESDQGLTLPELVIGQLASIEPWSKFRRNPLPTYNIPAEMRMQDPNLRVQPVLEFKDPNEGRLVRIGVHTLSMHRLEPYPGWNRFKPELMDAMDKLFGALPDIRVSRLGFRYVNIFKERDHSIKSIYDLNISASVSNEPLSVPLNLNYQRSKEDDHIVQVKLSSKDFVQSPHSHSIGALVDIDVFTPEGWSTNSASEVKSWIEAAHELEKQEFFRLFTDKMRAELVED